MIKKLTTDEALAKAREIDSEESASCHSVYVGTRFGHRHLIHRVHDLSGCDHISIGGVTPETEAALAAAGIDCR